MQSLTGRAWRIKNSSLQSKLHHYSLPIVSGICQALNSVVSSNKSFPPRPEGKILCTKNKPLRTELCWFRFSAWAVHAMVGLFMFIYCAFVGNFIWNPDKVPAVLTSHE
jgi:hypothetical protein